MPKRLRDYRPQDWATDEEIIAGGVSLDPLEDRATDLPRQRYGAALVAWCRDHPEFDGRAFLQERIRRKLAAGR